MNGTLCGAVLLLAMVGLVAVTGKGSSAQEEGLSQERIDAVAAMLPQQPTGLGAPIGDRAVWDKLAEDPSAAGIIQRAQKLLKEPFPEQPDDLYLDFSKTGNRSRWQAVSGQRRGRITPLVLAECLENNGRFIAAFEAIVPELCAERTWVMPAHDRGLANFNGETIDIDLGSASLAWNLATASYLLGDKLSAETRELIRGNVRRRILDPYTAMAKGEREVNWWMRTTNNWNAVCLGGVTGSALALAESREERAFFVVAAEHYSRNFLRGFTADGYCSEGVGYWNYGFGYYVLLAETVRQATGGGLNLFDREEVRAPAEYGAKIGIIAGICPAFADCGITSRPSSRIMQFVNRVYGLGLTRYDELDTSLGGSLYDAMIYSLPNLASQTPPAEEKSAGPGVRTWFDQAGILIGRPGEGTECRVGVAMKGGHNAEHHNHNDVGSYLVVVGERAVLLDPGSEKYTARTFSSKRYDSNVLNSFGHPVPLVAGQMQQTGRKAQGEVVRTEFTDEADTLELDMRSAYNVPELEKLQRTFVYSRAGAGSLSVTDDVAFESPQEFGTALVTLGQWKQAGPGEWVAYDFDEAMRVQIEVTGGEFEFGVEEIHEDCAGVPKRLGIKMTEPVKAASIAMTITPVAFPQDEGASLLRNGDFELETWCWDLSRDPMASISNEQAASGEFSLKIEDTETNRGSNTYSARMPAEGSKAYELRGKVFPVSGDGVGMYIRYRNEQGEEITPQDSEGNIPGVGTVPGDPGKWQPFAFPFETPPETTHMQVWIHSYNAAEVAAYLDDLEVVPSEE